MNWEAITAIATLIAAAAFILTVLVGARQLRATNAQLDHLRMAMQLEGTLKIFEELAAPEFVDALRFVRTDLSERLQDQAFREELTRPGAANPSAHKELIVLRQFEKIGTLVHHRLIDADTLYDFNCHEYISAWANLRPALTIMRQRTPSGFNFTEELCLGAWRWLVQRSPAETDVLGYLGDSMQPA